MIEHLHLILLALGAPIVVFGIVELAHYPLALAADLRRRRPPVFDTSTPLVSVIVPAYNEERVVGSCVDSILADSYLRKEVILVDDGSSDETLAIMRRYEHHDNVIVLTQANRGKGAALNTGIDFATGEICCFVDADGVFTTNTIEKLLDGFDDAHAEVPSTLRGLWKQRIRWTRGLVETAGRHRDLIASRHHGRLGWYLAYNLVTMLVLPLVQLLILVLVVWLYLLGHSPLPPGAPAILLWMGLGVAMAHVLIAVAFDRAWRDTRYLYVLPAVAFYTVFMSAVTARALWLEASGAPQRWNKLARTGVDSRSSSPHRP